VTPVAEGYYVAEGMFLPLVALTDSTLESAPFLGRRASRYFGGCAGAQPHVDNCLHGANPGARCVKNSEKPERFGRGLLGRPPKGKIAT